MYDNGPPEGHQTYVEENDIRGKHSKQDPDN